MPAPAWRRSHAIAPRRPARPVRRHSRRSPRRARPRRRRSAGVDDLILRVGTDQELETLNPWHSITYADYEMFQVQYELLVSFDVNLQPTPGFADDVVVVGRQA